MIKQMRDLYKRHKVVRALDAIAKSSIALTGTAVANLILQAFVAPQPVFAQEKSPEKPAISNHESEATEKKKLEEQVSFLWNRNHDRKYCISDDIIEKEINKWDPWVLDFIANIDFVKVKSWYFVGQYSNLKKRIEVPYCHLSRTDLISVFNPSDWNLPVQEYNRKTRVLKGEPIKWDLLSGTDLLKIRTKLEKYEKELPWFKEQFIDALDHEIVHALIDGEGGLLKSGLYSGPGEEERKQNILRMLSLESRREQLLGVYKYYLGDDYEAIIKQYGSIQNFITHDFSEQYQRFSNELKLYDANYDAIQKGSVLILTGFSSKPDKLSQKKIKLQDSWSQQKFDAEENNFFKKVDGMRFGEFKARHLVLLSQENPGPKISKMTYHIDELPYITCEINCMEEYDSSHKIASCYFYYDECKRKMYELGVVVKEDLRAFCNYLADSTEQHLLITETNARLFDSLMSIYLGRNNETLWRLCKEDFDFLSQLRCREEPIVRKALEKYRLALQLEKDGLWNEEMRNKLMYATEFSYNDKTFSWPETGFKFENPVPIEEPKF